MKSISQHLLTGNNLAHVVVYFLLGFIALFLIYSLVRSTFFKRTYKGFKFTTKKITYIAMMAAVSSAVTIVISLTLPITVLPPVRMSFEGIMIKIAGMFFGPLVGMLVGLITELITIMFVPSYIHIAYLLLELGVGFLSGIAAISQKWTGKRKWWTFLVINLFIIIYGTIMVLITSSYDQNVKIFGAEISRDAYKFVFIGVLAASLFVIWMVVGVFLVIKREQLLDIVLPIILLCVITEFLATTLIGSWGDSAFLGIPRDSGGYTSILMVRLVESPLKILFNTIILSTVYYILRPLVKAK